MTTNKTLARIVDLLNEHGYEINDEGVTHSNVYEAVELVLAQLIEAHKAIDEAPRKPSVVLNLAKPFTRERLEQIVNFHTLMTLPPFHSEIQELARMALASMDAKRRKLFTCSSCGAEGLDEPLESRCHCMGDNAHWIESAVYSAPTNSVEVDSGR
ncbi:hypothetical protein [Citrobacter werkmanii]|uniref:hypothetical protein n=1 Tax=Citrobacter werkmanii TaxID=67827 RepID=UPI0037CC1324